MEDGGGWWDQLGKIGFGIVNCWGFSNGFNVVGWYAFFLKRRLADEKF